MIDSIDKELAQRRRESGLLTGDLAVVPLRISLMPLIPIAVEDPPPPSHGHGSSKYSDEEIDQFIEAARRSWVRDGTDSFATVRQARNKAISLTQVLKRRLPDNERLTARAYKLGESPDAECVYALKVVPRHPEQELSRSGSPREGPPSPQPV
jgi:hypothetical protein